MSLFVKIADFDDICPKDKYTAITLQKYLDDLEEGYLIKLFGATLFGEFKTDFEIIGTIPTEQRFLDVWNAFNTDNNSQIVTSIGIKKMLVGFIAFEFLRDEMVKKTIGGLVQNEQVNGVIASFQSSDLLSLHNKSANTFNSLRWFMNEDLTTYEGYNGTWMSISIG